MSATPYPSPCVNICRMNEATGLREGCLRTLDEIACWSLLDDAEKSAVWDELEQRRAQQPPAADATRSPRS
jgi:predicted Fe-S protein YdhL (DUF1289 family)